jgi:dolichol-phosphate mannosyltransferase
VTHPLVIIPTYNEADNIAATVSRVLSAAPGTHLLIVDDASPDGTGRIADHLALTCSSVHVLHRAGKAGLGAAYRAGFAWALEYGYREVIQMDADGSHDAADIPRLLEALTAADVVIGSRWVPGGAALGWPAHRLALSRGGSSYARKVLGLAQRDVTSGFRAFRMSALDAIRPEEVASTGYSFQIEMLQRAAGAELQIAEVPIVFRDRTLGRSKMSLAIVAEAMARVTIWGLRRLITPAPAIQAKAPAHV